MQPGDVQWCHIGDYMVCACVREYGSVCTTFGKLVRVVHVVHPLPSALLPSCLAMT
jgi:hypothetical protein